MLGWLRGELKGIRLLETFGRLTHWIHLQRLVRGDVLGNDKVDQRLDVYTNFRDLNNVRKNSKDLGQNLEKNHHFFRDPYIINVRVR